MIRHSKSSVPLLAHFVESYTLNTGSKERPEIGKPEVGKPEVGKPEVGKPEVGKPEIRKPETYHKEKTA